MWQYVVLSIFFFSDNVRSDLVQKSLYFKTANNGSYQFTGLQKDNRQGTVLIHIQADKNAYICLTRMFPTCNLKIIVGAEDNTKLQYLKGEELVVNNNAVKLLKENEFRSFWLRWNRTTYNSLEIKFGVEGSVVGSASWVDNTFLDINYIGFNSGADSKANWTFQALYEDDITEISNQTFVTTSKKVLRSKKFFSNFYPIIDNEIIFEVRAACEVHVALTREPSSKGDDIILVSLGTFHNNQSSIVSNLVSVSVKSVELDGYKYKKFIIKINQTVDANVINVTRGDDSIVMIGREKSGNKRALKYYSISSDDGVTANWLIKDRVKSVPKFFVTNDLKYQYYPIENKPYRSRQPLRFRVMGSQNAYVALSRNGIDYNYQVMIGAWSNLRTIIRKDDLSDEEIWVETDGILKSNTYVNFWIDWAYTVEIESSYQPLRIDEESSLLPNSILEIFVGYENDANPIVAFKDNASDHSKFTHFGLSCYDSELFWQFDDIDTISYVNPNITELPVKGVYDFNDTFTLIETSNYNYTFFSMVDNNLKFNVIAPSDACIILSEAPVVTYKNIQICLGTSFNTKSYLKFTSGGVTKKITEISTPHILHSKALEYRSFWLNWDGDYIYFGLAYEDSKMYYRIFPQPRMTNRFVGFSNGYDSVAHWQINDTSFETRTNGSYWNFPIAQNEVFFRVRALDEAYIRLTNSLNVKNVDMLVMTLGAENNTKIYIQRSGNVHKFNVTNTLHATTFKQYRITWTQTGELILSRPEISNVWTTVFSWTDTEPFQINYFGTASRNATWSIKAIPASKSIWYNHHNCFVTPPSDCDISIRNRLNIPHDDDDDDDEHCDNQSLTIAKHCESMLPLNSFVSY